MIARADTNLEATKSRPEFEKMEKISVVCEPFANRCNICGAFFGEGDDVCGGSGRHIIGRAYLVLA